MGRGVLYISSNIENGKAQIETLRMIITFPSDSSWTFDSFSKAFAGTSKELDEGGYEAVLVDHSFLSPQVVINLSKKKGYTIVQGRFLVHQIESRLMEILKEYKWGGVMSTAGAYREIALVKEGVTDA